MDLYILRHAKTNQHSETGKDFDRKLLPRGKKQALHLGTHFHKTNLHVDQLYCSDAQRTRETLSFIKENHSLGPIEYKPELYMCSKSDLLSFLWKLDHGNSVFLIGHNNGISDLASYLTDDYISLSTGEYVHISFRETHWSEVTKGMGTIQEQHRPDA
jgi:phosphohistidine phosphatase